MSVPKTCSDSSNLLILGEPSSIIRDTDIHDRIKHLEDELYKMKYRNRFSEVMDLVYRGITNTMKELHYEFKTCKCANIINFPSFIIR